MLTLSALEQRNLQQRGSNAYLVENLTYSEVSETILNDRAQTTENYEQVPEFLVGDDQIRNLTSIDGQGVHLPDVVLYHTVHRLESSTGDDDDDVLLADNMTIDETFPDETSLLPVTRAIPRKPASYRLSSSSSVSSLGNRLYESINSQVFHELLGGKRSDHESLPAIYERMNTNNTRPSHSSSVGSVNNFIYESASPKDKFVQEIPTAVAKETGPSQGNLYHTVHRPESCSSADNGSVGLKDSIKHSRADNRQYVKPSQSSSIGCIR